MYRVYFRLSRGNESDVDEPWDVIDETETLQQAAQLAHANDGDMVILNARYHGDVETEANDSLFRPLVNVGGPGASGVQAAMTFVRHTSGADNNNASDAPAGPMMDDDFSPTRLLLDNPERLGTGGEFYLRRKGTLFLKLKFHD